MSFDTITANYKAWAASDDNPDWQIVECLTFSHTQFTDMHVCDYGESIQVTIESGGGSRTYDPVPFTLIYPEMKITTEQTLRVNIDALDGALYGALKAMTPAHRLEPIVVEHRTYLDGDTSGPVFLPVPTFSVKTVIVGHDTLDVECVSTMLPNKRSGTVYTLEQFPTLRDV